MTQPFTAFALFLFVCAFAVHATPPDVVARSELVQPSFDIAMPAAQESPDAATVHAALNPRVADGR
jgi:hypothetical protein